MPLPQAIIEIFDSDDERSPPRRGSTTVGFIDLTEGSPEPEIRPLKREPLPLPQVHSLIERPKPSSSKANVPFLPNRQSHGLGSAVASNPTSPAPTSVPDVLPRPQSSVIRPILPPQTIGKAAKQQGIAQASPAGPSKPRSPALMPTLAESDKLQNAISCSNPVEVSKPHNPAFLPILPGLSKPLSSTHESTTVLQIPPQSPSVTNRIPSPLPDTNNEIAQDYELRLEAGFTFAKPFSRSKLPGARPSSQSSVDRSTSADSPIAQRRREKTTSRVDGSRRDQSPRAAMAMMQRNASAEQQSVFVDIEELAESLEQLEQTVLEDQAETTRWLLYDAKRIYERQLGFKDKVSPFASMQSVVAGDENSAPPAFTSIRMDRTYSIKKKLLKKSSIQVSTTKVSSAVPRVPKYTAHTNIKRNVLCGDDEQLRYIPFLASSTGDVSSESHKKLMKELDAHYTAKRSGSVKETEWATKLRSYLSSWIKILDLGLDQRVLDQYIIEKEGNGLQQSKKELAILRQSYKEPLRPEERDNAASFSQAFLSVFHVPLKDVLLPKERLQSMIEGLQKGSSGRSYAESPRSPTSEVNFTDQRLGTYSNLTCLICGAICCQTHGDYTSIPAPHIDGCSQDEKDEAVYTHQPFGMHYNELLWKRNHRYDRTARESILPLQPDFTGQSCGEECFRTFDFNGKAGEWTNENIAAMRSFLVSMRAEGAEPCNISFVLELPCWQVHCKMVELRRTYPQVQPQVPLLRRFKIDWYDNRKKVLVRDWTSLTDAHLHQTRIQAQPCLHEGPCQNDCPCVEANILCETYCICCDDCPRKFTGCVCHVSGIVCIAENCICIAMNRECGPQCKSCGAISRINPINKHNDNLFATGCQNISLQRGVDRKLLIGESQLEGVGFGLYLAEPVRKGDYLSEYTGEVISEEECERRGIVYDKKYLSFLFNLNKDWVIDAMRLGNKTRYMNHADSLDEGLNCEAKIVLVNGEHRIKFVAIRHIAAGEELLFDYGRKFAEKHGLNKRLPKSKERGKKGVVEDDALAALDGNRKGRMTAIRGGRGGKGGRKERKTAPTKRDVEDHNTALRTSFEEDEALGEIFGVEVEEDDDFEDLEDMDIGGRKKRKINRPMRYTR